MVMQCDPIYFSVPFKDFKYTCCFGYKVEQGGCASFQSPLCTYFFRRNLFTVVTCSTFDIVRLSQRMQEEKKEEK